MWGYRMEIKKESTPKTQPLKYGEYEKEFYLSKKELADFLRGIADQLEKGEKITISTNEWEIPFEYREPIEVEIEYESEEGEENELEIEIEFKSKRRGGRLQAK